MKITVKEVKILSTGANDHGEWKLVKVTTEDIEYTTFAEGAELIPVGSTINITNMDKDTQDRESFKKFEIVGGAQEGDAKASESNEKPAVKVDARDRSIARAVALKAAVEAEGYKLKNGGEPLSVKGITGVAEKFEEWLTR